MGSVISTPVLGSDSIPIRDADGALLRHVSGEEALSLLTAGNVEAVGRKAVRYLRLTERQAEIVRQPSMRDWTSEASFTVRQRGNSFEHINRRCDTYGPETGSANQRGAANA